MRSRQGAYSGISHTGYSVARPGSHHKLYIQPRSPLEANCWHLFASTAFFSYRKPVPVQRLLAWRTASRFTRRSHSKRIKPEKGRIMSQ